MPMSNEHAATERSERIAIWVLIAIASILSTAPDLYGWSLSRPDHVYVGASYNIDDSYVYMAWARQAADGHFFAKNLFTTAPQLGRQFNLYFLLIGNLCRLTHLPLVKALLLARVVFGVALLWLISRFIAWSLPGSARARLTAFALSAVGTGLGWIYYAKWLNKNNSVFPVDSWQPEAFTFLSMLMSSLFVVSTLLIVACIFFLLRAEEKDSMRDAVFAGLCALLLGNIHSYDVLHVGAVWGLYLLVKGIAKGKLDRGDILRAVVAGAICVPTVAYQYFLFKKDPIFHARAEVLTLSYEFITYVLGYGLTLFFAIEAVVLMGRSKRFAAFWRNEQVPLMLTCWVVAVFALVYIPSSFQRKMIMGVHIPLCLLAGAAAAYLGNSLASRYKVSAGFAPLLFLLLSVPTSLIWIARDVRHIRNGDSETQSPTYLTADDLRVFDWINHNTKPSDAFVGYPSQMLFVPAYCDRRVWCGHWGETPDYPTKVRETIKFSKNEILDPRHFLETTGATYLVWPSVTDTFTSPPDYLVPVYGNASYTIYRIL